MNTEPQARRHVAVIGGGIIGLSSAYRLAQAGLDVTLLERGVIGNEASWGNAGWIVPSLIQPFNAPGAVSDAFKTMLTRGGQIALRQFPTPKLAFWGLSFLHHSSAHKSTESMRALATMAHDAVEATGQLAKELGFELHRTGLLVPFKSQKALEAYGQAHAKVEQLGYTGRAEWLDSQQLKEREPSLGEGLAGGVHLLDELSTRPDSMTSALAHGFRTVGGDLCEHTTVTSIKAAHGNRWSVTTDSGQNLIVDAVVLAAGENSNSLLRGTGAHIPLQSGRGCSVTLPPGITLNQATKLAEVRVACSPFDNGQVRISGTFDLVRTDAPTNRKRMQHVLDAATPYLPGLAEVDLSEIDIWSGSRPTTPDSLPVVGPVGSTPGLYAATGHGTLGMTLAAGTANTIKTHVSRLMKDKGVTIT